MRMPPEWAPHERTLMAWPCRSELWGELLAEARRDYAAVAAAIAAFEPVTMVANPGEQAAQARSMCGEGVEVVELPIDDSWMRDSGPIFVLGDGRRTGVHFGFNAWGEKFSPWDSDEAAGGELARRYGDDVVEAPFVLEGGSIAVDAAGTLITTEECLLHPSRNPTMSKDDIEDGLRSHLGVDRVVWLEKGLEEDRDTNGHVDLVAAFTPSGDVLLQAGPPGTEDERRMEVNRERLEAAGLGVRRLEVLPVVEVAGEQTTVSHMNFYIANGGVIVPLSGLDSDDEALRVIGSAYPDHEVVGVPGAVLAHGGGGPHCITQQVPAR